MVQELAHRIDSLLVRRTSRDDNALSALSALRDRRRLIHECKKNRVGEFLFGLQQAKQIFAQRKLLNRCAEETWEEQFSIGTQKYFDVRTSAKGRPFFYIASCYRKHLIVRNGAQILQ